ncbi:hypothetical protein DFH29DRAFT_882346 [Suillus ampliporus]|nr:hypothetical protein DFH29DRAFT_882346 [Suillus ampliporus]
MSYNLRSRTRARASSVSTPASEKIDRAEAQNKGPSLMAGANYSVESPLSSVAGSPKTITKGSPALRPVRSYSDVVRASSPVSNLQVAQESNVQPNLETGIGKDPNEDLAGSNDEHDSHRVTENEEHELTSSEEDDDDRPWIEVLRKGRNRAKTPEALSNEQRETVGKAERMLTQAERQRLAKRNFSVSTRETATTRETDHGEGPSKGKGTDPRNWGTAMIEDEDLNLDEQRAALESFRTAKELASRCYDQRPLT